MSMSVMNNVIKVFSGKLKHINFIVDRRKGNCVTKVAAKREREEITSLNGSNQAPDLIINYLLTIMAALPITVIIHALVIGKIRAS
jgi:hypothetical protein